MRGKYTLRNPEKYPGNSKSIVWRSIWEYRLMAYLDRHPHVLEWSSEEHRVSYYHEKHRTYYPDFWVRYIDAEDNTVEALLEVKPHSQRTMAINVAKWAAAEQWCSENNMRFIVITEEHLYGRKK